LVLPRLCDGDTGVECRGARALGFQGFIQRRLPQTVPFSSLGSATNNSGVLTQNDINNALQDAFTNGADPELVFCLSGHQAAD